MKPAYLAMRLRGRLHWRDYGQQGCMWSVLQDHRVVHWMSNLCVDLRDIGFTNCGDSLEIVRVNETHKVPDS